MSIQDDIAALEKALEAGPIEGPWTHDHPQFPDEYQLCIRTADDEASPVVVDECATEQTAAFIAACSPDRIRRLLDALKDARETEDVVMERLQREHDQLSKAIGLLSAVAKHGSHALYVSGDNAVETMHCRIAAFLKECGHD